MNSSFTKPASFFLRFASIFSSIVLLLTSCATTEYNPTCLKECGRGNLECTRTCASMRVVVPEGEFRRNRAFRGTTSFDNCSARCESIYQKCRKRCERVLTVDAKTDRK